MKTLTRAITKIFTGLLLLSAFTQASSAELVFSSLDISQTNRGTVNINGYDRYFSVTFPPSYNRKKMYPVVLFFHGCLCRPTHTEEKILSYLD
jgi:poly(3-hydroxybutyrate) depolymerase